MDFCPQMLSGSYERMKMKRRRKKKKVAMNDIRVESKQQNNNKANQIIIVFPKLDKLLKTTSVFIHQ